MSDILSASAHGFNNQLDMMNSKAIHQSNNHQVTRNGEIGKTYCQTASFNTKSKDCARQKEI